MQLKRLVTTVVLSVVAGLFLAPAAHADYYLQQHIATTAFTDSGPATIWFNNRMYVIYDDGNELRYTTTSDDTSWSLSEQGAWSPWPERPAAVVWNGRMYVFWRNPFNGLINYKSSANGTDLISQTTYDLGPASYGIGGVAPVVSNTELRVYWTGSDNQLWLMNFSTIGHADAVTNGRSDTGPTAAVIRGRTVLVWKGVGGDTGMYWSFATDGSGLRFVSQEFLGTWTSHSPSVAADDPGDQLYLVWKADRDDAMYQLVFNPNSWHWESLLQVVPEGGTSNSPAVAPAFGRMHMVWKGKDDDRNMYYARQRF